ncbi:MAG: tetratricopeptide repeat protein [Kiloniellales bacterium]|nr:tetratricopeptide repeat protein [Kiloniellales bacterium]
MALLLILPGFGAPATATPDKRVLIETLRQRDFAALEAQLGALLSAYEAGSTSDVPLDVAFSAFGNSAPELEPHLDAWVAAHPESGAARLARGVFHSSVGWHLRGARTAARTRDESLARMRARFAQAEADLAAAIARNPRLAPAYDHLIGIHMARKRESDLHRVFRQGIAANPDSIEIRFAYYYSLRPRWNRGSAAVALFEIWLEIQLLELQVEERPQLRPLLGYYHAARGDRATWNGDHEAALAHYREAVEAGDFWQFHYLLGRSLYRLKRYDAALASFDRALELRPQVANSHHHRAKALRKLGRLEDALKGWDQALALDPMDPGVLVQQAYALRQAGRTEDALANLERAMVYGDLDQSVRSARGRLFLYDLEDPERAREDLAFARDADPRDSAKLYDYGLALYRLWDCRCLEVFEAYLSRCLEGQRCGQSERLWVGQALPQIRGYCADKDQVSAFPPEDHG